MKIRDRSPNLKIINDLDGPVGAAGNLNGPILLIPAADDPCQGDNTQIDVDIDIERTHLGFGNQLGFDFIADQIVIPDIAIAPFTNLKIIGDGSYTGYTLGDFHCTGGFFTGADHTCQCDVASEFRNIIMESGITQIF